VISMELAHQLADAGVEWVPAPGDRFVIPRTELESQVFMVADMVVEVETVRGRGVVKFNGTTEWALDSMAQGDVVWLPRTDQLIAALGDAFQALTRLGGGPTATWVATIEVRGAEDRFSDPDADTALARALLSVLARR